MQAILKACRTGRIPAKGALVIAPSFSAPAVEKAREMGAEVAIVNPDDEHFGEELLALLDAEQIDLLCLAGYMKLLPQSVVKHMDKRIINIHPALLPKYGGKGMYGARVHQAVLDAGDRESGCTVHYVTENYDEGEILLQVRCPVEPDDSAETLAARILLLEHECYVEAIRLWTKTRNGAPVP
jgi:formyltetrahydrofolate-dependent phosphoribosylglycinamide formyltransferase